MESRKEKNERMRKGKKMSHGGEEKVEEDRKGKSKNEFTKQRRERKI